MFIVSKRSLNKVFLGEETDSNYTPHTAPHVHRYGIDRIVNAIPHQELRNGQVDPPSNYADNDCSVRVNSGTASCNRDQACQAAIHGVAQVVRVDAGFQVIQVC